MKKRNPLRIALTSAVLVSIAVLLAWFAVQPRHSITLSWTASKTPGAISYNVYRGTAHGGPYTRIATGLHETTFKDKTVQPGQTYYYLVTSFNGMESTASGEITGTVPNH